MLNITWSSRTFSNFVMQCFGFWTWYLSHFLLKGYFMQCWWECKYTQTSWEGNLALYIRTKSNNSSNSKACVDYFHFIGIYSMRISTQAYEGLCARLFMTALYIFQTCVISAIKKKKSSLESKVRASTKESSYSLNKNEVLKDNDS